MKKLILIATSLIFLFVSAEARNMRPTTAPTTTTATVTPTPTATPVNTGNVNIQNPGLYTAAESAGKAADNGNRTMITWAVSAGVIAAGVCAGSGGSSPDCIKWSLTAAMFGGVIANMFGDKKKESNDLLAEVSVDHPPTTAPPPTATSPGSNTTDGVTRYNQAIQTLRNRGIIVNPARQSVTMPNGRTYTQANLTTPAGMQAAGITPASMAKTEKELKEKAAELSRGSDSTEGGYETAGGRGGTSEVSGEYILPTESRLGIDRNPAQVQGLSVNYNGEPIGVSRSDLFQAITNRVRAVDNRDGFLTSP